MNIKQLLIAIFSICASIIVIFYGPKYKITEIGPDNFIKTEQSSALYKRCTGKVKLYWNRIFLYESIVLLFCGFLIFLVREKPAIGHIKKR